MPYMQDAEREGDDELAELFRPAHTESGLRRAGKEQVGRHSAG